MCICRCGGPPDQKKVTAGGLDHRAAQEPHHPLLLHVASTSYYSQLYCIVVFWYPQQVPLSVIQHILNNPHPADTQRHVTPLRWKVIVLITSTSHTFLRLLADRLEGPPSR